jgi:beta-lactamase regulating signal transducer with metallopeptidase domain
MGLEIKTNKEPGTVSRVTPAARPPMVGLLILLLTGIEFVLIYITSYTVFALGANSPSITSPQLAGAPLINWFKSDQRIISLWLAGIFFNMAYIIFLYQRFFMDHVTIVKRRFRKWEDEGVQLHA